MTQPPVWSSPAPAQPAAAAQAVYGRVLLFASPRHGGTVPQYLHETRSGYGLCGPKAGLVAAKVRRDGYEGLLLADPGAYRTQAATEEEPFDLPTGQLFGGDLDTVLQDQFDRGASLAVAPSRFIHAGDMSAFNGLVRAAQAVERDDVIIPVAVDAAWLRPEFLGKLTAGLRRIQAVKAIALGGQGNPMASFAKATENLRALVGEVPNLGLWLGDQLTAFDCMAFGAAFAVIGAGGSLRHVVPPSEEPEARRPFNHTPSVFIPEMLRYSVGEYIAERYANCAAPRCYCAACGDRSLDSFNSRRGEVRAAAQAHNGAVWTSTLDDLFDHATADERQVWWKGHCRAAVEAQKRESRRIEQPGAFKPSKPLAKMAELPLSSEVSSTGG
ncbi:MULTISPECIES: hypothetical protein [unclassified Micromonospora]|uniref:hypothetical protein n=1 Tax=unclassified Micromonospora TaxID=2617518 RepID=UPI00098D2B5C|nr:MULTISPECIES: hypothetical protein [unclassified Micromonospora]MDI5937150.1 hypothetical protein [Micromonospora sp. DH15]OON27068.1 hypothetical protein BSA16_33980 [Micromonospora sp. Rc5]